MTAIQKVAARPMRAGWFTAERALLWCMALAICEATWVLGLFVRAHRSAGLVQTDFSCFWTAASLALHAPSDVYDPVKLAVIEHTRQGLPESVFQPFIYPPSFLVLLLPFALLPPAAALFAFIAAGLAPFLLCVRQLLPHGRVWLAGLAFPGTLVNASTGQNGFFTALCFGGGALLLDEHPFLAGLCLGALSCKPHLAVLVPVALLAARRWRAAAGMCTSAIGLAACSSLVFGLPVWRAFVAASFSLIRRQAGSLSQASRSQSAFGAAHVLHLPAHLDLVCQAIVSLMAVVALIAVARLRPGGRAEIAVLVMATLLFTPYVMDYDLVTLAIPLAFLFEAAQRDGWRSWERPAALVAYMLPLATSFIAKNLGLPLAPLLLSAIGAVIARRAVAKPALNAYDS